MNNNQPIPQTDIPQKPTTPADEAQQLSADAPSRPLWLAGHRSPEP